MLRVVAAASCFLRIHPPLFGFGLVLCSVSHFVFLFCVSPVLLLSSSRRRLTASSITYHRHPAPCLHIIAAPILAVVPPSSLSLSPQIYVYPDPTSSRLLSPSHRYCLAHLIVSHPEPISSSTRISHLSSHLSLSYPHQDCISTRYTRTYTHTYMRTPTHTRTHTRTCTLARARTPDVGLRYSSGRIPTTGHAVFILSPVSSSFPSHIIPILVSPCSHSYGRNYLGSVSAPVPVPPSARLGPARCT